MVSYPALRTVLSLFGIKSRYIAAALSFTKYRSCHPCANPLFSLHRPVIPVFILFKKFFIFLFTNPHSSAIIHLVLARWCSRLARQPVTLEVDGSSPFRVAIREDIPYGMSSFLPWIRDSNHQMQLSGRQKTPFLSEWRLGLVRNWPQLYDQNAVKQLHTACRRILG